MLAKRRVGFVLSIQVIPAQLGLHKDLFYFYTFGPFCNGMFCTKTLIVTKIKYVDVAFLGKWLIGSVLSHLSAKKDSGTTFKCLQSSAHLRQRESTIFWSFSQSWYTLLRAVASNLRRGENNYAHGRGLEWKRSVVQECCRSLYAWQWNEWWTFANDFTVAVMTRCTFCACWLEAFHEWCRRDECKPHVGSGTTAAPVCWLRSEFRMLPFRFLNLSEFQLNTCLCKHV